MLSSLGQYQKELAIRLSRACVTLREVEKQALH